MVYIMREPQLRQRESLEAAVILSLSSGLAIGLQTWGLSLLGLALALSLLRDAWLLRRRVRQGRIWICEGRVQALGRDHITLRQGGELMTLRLTKPLHVKPGDFCRLALQRGRHGYVLVGFQRRDCCIRPVAAVS